MKIGDRATLKAVVRYDGGDGMYSVDIPSYPARFPIRSSKKLKVGAELLLEGEIAMLVGDERVTVALDQGGRVTVRADTLAKADKPNAHPKLFDKQRR